MGLTEKEPFLVCDRLLCDSSIAVVPSSRRDSIVYGLVFCSPECRALEAAVRKQRARRAVNADHATRRRRDLRNKYGISVEEWDTTFDEQLGRCAICLVPLIEVRVHTDHSHRTGLFRGILCVDCNHGLGKFKDDREILQRAVQYLSDHESLAPRSEVIAK